MNASFSSADLRSEALINFASTINPNIGIKITTAAGVLTGSLFCNLSKTNFAAAFDFCIIVERIEVFTGYSASKFCSLLFTVTVFAACSFNLSCLASAISSARWAFLDCFSSTFWGWFSCLTSGIFTSGAADFAACLTSCTLGSGFTICFAVASFAGAAGWAFALFTVTSVFGGFWGSGLLILFLTAFASAISVLYSFCSSVTGPLFCVRVFISSGLVVINVTFV